MLKEMVAFTTMAFVGTDGFMLSHRTRPRNNTGTPAVVIDERMLKPLAVSCVELAMLVYEGWAYVSPWKQLGAPWVWVEMPTSW